jgi:hemerythrin-like metal-binding protein
VTGEILHRLIDYTVHHFSAEEKLMEKHNYPGLVAHRAEHKALTAKVMEFQNDFDAGNTTIAVQLMTFLQDWLRNHILSVDQRYSDVLNTKGVH